MGFRQVHLDFHTGPWIRDVGRRFDPQAFGRMVRRANVDSVTVFAKCHHGHLYFDTDHPARHPSLPEGMDLLAQQVDALRRQGIRAPIYISVQVDEFAANSHPEWVALRPDGGLVGPGPFKAGWQVLDMASPYLDYLREQVGQVLAKFNPVDGVFFDMCWNQPSVSAWAKARMAEWGLDADSEQDRSAYAARLARQYMRQLAAQVRRACPNASVYFNSRPLGSLRGDLPVMTHVEIEALPTGGWGYMYFPTHVRYVRTLTRRYLGMTARFHKSWADFGGLKPEAALKYEVCQMLAHGASCSIGDQMHPRGTFDRPAWEMIGRMYAYAGACRPWCQGAVSAADVALLRPGAPAAYHAPAGGSVESAVRMLSQLRQQFDVVDAQADLTGYRLAVLPDEAVVDADLAARLDRFVAAGGAVLATGDSGIAPDGKITWRKLPILGPATPSPFQVTYFRPAADLRASLSATRKRGASRFGGLSRMDHVLYLPGRRCRPARGAAVLARVVEPYFDRSWQHFCSHAQTPPARLTRYPAAVRKGSVAAIVYPVFRIFGTHGSISCRQLVSACIQRLLGRTVVEAAGPVSMETSLMRKGRRHVLHLVYCPAERRTKDLDLVEDCPTLHDIEVSVALPRCPKRVYLAPSMEAAAFDWTGGRATLTVGKIDGHQMVVFE